jgi:hypothetical protein
MDKVTVIIVSLALLVSGVSAAEISGHVRAGNAWSSGNNPCVLLDDVTVFNALDSDGTFIVYAPEGDHVISVTGVLRGFEEYCYVKVRGNVADHQCEFEGNGLATPSVIEITPEPTPTTMPTTEPTAVPTTVPTATPTPSPTVTITPVPTPTFTPTVTPTPTPTIVPTTIPTTTVPTTTVTTVPPTTVPTTIPTTVPTVTPKPTPTKKPPHHKHHWWQWWWDD